MSISWRVLEQTKNSGRASLLGISMLYPAFVLIAFIMSSGLNLLLDSLGSKTLGVTDEVGTPRQLIRERLKRT